MEEGRTAFKILTGPPTGKIPLVRPRRKREHNIRMDLNQTNAYGLISRHAVAVMHSGQ